MSARFLAPIAAGAVTGALVLGLGGCVSEGVVGAAGASTGGTKAASSSAPSVPDSSAQTSGPAVTGTALSPSGGATTASTAGASSSASQSDPSALASSLKKLNDLWTDAGCKTGLRGFGTYLTAAQESPAKGNAAIPGAIRDLRAGAQSTQRPAARQAMNDMVKDLQAISDATKAGQTPDKGKLRNDWQIMGNACSG